MHFTHFIVAVFYCINYYCLLTVAC